MNKSDQKFYDELSYYTLSHPNPSFIHQNVVDAYAAQHADNKTKSIKLTFALVGLYLLLEKNFTGRQVQIAHMRMGRFKKNWPQFKLPDERGTITITDVLAKPEGKERDEMIRKWCASVWEAYKEIQQQIRDLVKKELDV